MKEKILFAWSGGKDSAMALYELQKQNACEILSLLTTVTSDYDRISMHGVRSALMEEQAKSVGLTLEKVYISKVSSNQEYEKNMGDKLESYKKLGVSKVAFGDIFLEDLKRYREEKLSEIDFSGIFPIWERDSSELANTFIDIGFKAIVTCVDTNVLDKSFCGRLYDKQFLLDLPKETDPCGENGEFHTFVYDGPIFRCKVGFDKGELTLRDNRFYYCELTPR